MLHFHLRRLPLDLVLLIVYSVPRLRLLVAESSLFLLVEVFLPILRVSWVVFLSRMATQIIAGTVLVCLRLLVHFFLTLQKSMLRLLLLARLIILFSIAENSKVICFDLARTFLKPVLSPKVFAAVVDFADPPSDSEHSGDSDSFPCESVSLN